MSTITTKANQPGHNEYWEYVSTVLFDENWMRYLPLNATILFPLAVEATLKNRTYDEITAYLETHLHLTNQDDDPELKKREAHLQFLYNRSGLTYPRSVKELIDLMIQFGLFQEIKHYGVKRLALTERERIPKPEDVLKLTKKELRILQELRAKI
jgi:hypothetical protein